MRGMRGAHGTPRGISRQDAGGTRGRGVGLKVTPPTGTHPACGGKCGAALLAFVVRGEGSTPFPFHDFTAWNARPLWGEYHGPHRGRVFHTRDRAPFAVVAGAGAAATTNGDPISVGWVCRCAVGDTTFARNDTTPRRAPRRCGAPGSLPWVVSVRTPRATASGCGRHSRAHRCAPASPV